MTRLLDNTRRGWLRSAVTGLGAGAGAASGWLEAFAADAAQHPERARSVILLWMNGGPATIDLWDLKPGHAHGGRRDPPPALRRVALEQDLEVVDPAAPGAAEHE